MAYAGMSTGPLRRAIHLRKKKMTQARRIFPEPHFS